MNAIKKPLLRSDSVAGAAVAGSTSEASRDREDIPSRRRLTFTRFFETGPIQTSIASGVTWHALFTFAVHA